MYYVPINTFCGFFAGFPHADTLFRTIRIGVSLLNHPGWHQKQHEYQGLILQPHHLHDVLEEEEEDVVPRPLSLIMLMRKSSEGNGRAAGGWPYCCNGGGGGASAGFLKSKINGFFINKASKHILQRVLALWESSKKAIWKIHIFVKNYYSILIEKWILEK